MSPPKSCPTRRAGSTACSALGSTLSPAAPARSNATSSASACWGYPKADPYRFPLPSRERARVRGPTARARTRRPSPRPSPADAGEGEKGGGKSYLQGQLPQHERGGPPPAPLPLTQEREKKEVVKATFKGNSLSTN